MGSRSPSVVARRVGCTECYAESPNTNQTYSRSCRTSLRIDPGDPPDSFRSPFAVPETNTRTERRNERRFHIANHELHPHSSEYPVCLVEPHFEPKVAGTSMVLASSRPWTTHRIEASKRSR